MTKIETFPVWAKNRKEKVEQLVKAREFLKTAPDYFGKHMSYYVMITDKDGKCWPFEEAFFGDFNDADQEDALQNWEEVTSFGNNDFYQKFIPIDEIEYIEYYKERR